MIRLMNLVFQSGLDLNVESQTLGRTILMLPHGVEGISC